MVFSDRLTFLIQGPALLLLSLTIINSGCNSRDNPSVISLTDVKSDDIIIGNRVPKAGAVGLAFQDTANQGGFLDGEIRISRASDESTVSSYVLYWGSGPQSKLADRQPIAKLSKSSGPLSFKFPERIIKPAQATHFLVFTSNLNGEMNSGASAMIEDKGLPKNAAVSAAFNDNNITGGKLTGKIQINKASDESDVTDYVIYWGHTFNSKSTINADPIAILSKEKDLSFELSDVSKPADANHILVFTKNKDGEMSIGVSVPIMDLGVPKNAASGVTFTDTNRAGGKLTGTIKISKALDENDITQYAVYWGDREAKLKSDAKPFSVVGKGSDPLAARLDNAAIPAGANSILVFTNNNDGEMATGVSVPIKDLGVPVHPPISASFIDSNPVGGQLAGNITIDKASDETDVTHYVIYWGQNSTIKSNSNLNAIAELSKDSQLSYKLNNVEKPTDATHFLVFSKNKDGAMATGVSVPINDLGLPQKTAHGASFTDTNPTGGKLTGSISITKAQDEKAITQYVIYWGKINTKLTTNASPIARVGKGSDPLSARLDNVDIPAGANALLVFTSNDDGEMATGISIPIRDLGLPESTASKVSFSDTNAEVGKLTGQISITKAADESKITDYVIYWGKNPYSKSESNLNMINSLPKGTSPLSYSLNNETIPTDATHILVFTKNAQGEMGIGYPLLIIDKGLPVHAALGGTFTDNNLLPGKLSGKIQFKNAVDESKITDYAIYWGSHFRPFDGYPKFYGEFVDGPTKIPANSNPIVVLPKGTSPLSFDLQDVSKPEFASFLLVFTRYNDGEMAKGHSIPITDKTLSVRNIFAANGTTYAATNHGLFSSVDNGTTWENKTATNGLASNDVAGVFASGDTVYTATSKGLSFSTDARQTWINKATADGLLSDNVTSVFVLDDKIIYAGTDKGLSISLDGGGTWKNKTTIDGLVGNEVKRVVASGSNIYAATAQGLSISKDGGTKWVTPDLRRIYDWGRTIFGVSVSGSSLYAAIDSNGLSISKDYGVTWVSKSDGKDLPCRHGSDVYAVDSKIYVPDYYVGLCISSDGGVTWVKKAWNGIAHNDLFVIYSSGGKLFAGGYYGFYISTDDGTTWVNKTQSFIPAP